MRSAKLPCIVQVREWEECLTVLGGWDDADADAMDVQVCLDPLLLMHLPCMSCACRSVVERARRTAHASQGSCTSQC